VYSYDALFRFYRKHFSLGLVLTVWAMVSTLLSLQWALNWIKSRFHDNPVYRQNESDLKQIIQLCFGSVGKKERSSVGTL